MNLSCKFLGDLWGFLPDFQFTLECSIRISLFNQHVMIFREHRTLCVYLQDNCSSSFHGRRVDTYARLNSLTRSPI
jgi:hypothetical protein